ncbi:unnamed protein product, partial [Meganyctiphanes norvegica]
FAQMHFHWGSESSLGSEHTIDGVRYPLELHIISYKSSYGGLAEAISQPDGLANIAVLFEITTESNAALTPLLNALMTIPDAGDYGEVKNPYPIRAFLPKDTRKFYRYEGSLTTPSCNEVVVWTIFDTTAKVSENQLRILRSMKTGTGVKLVNNFRPPQALNNRK